jgi:hypothetical protein
MSRYSCDARVITNSSSGGQALPYDEPWGWMQPTRHAHGALLLEQGHTREAADVYAADLGLDPTLNRPACIRAMCGVRMGTTSAYSA